LGCRGDEDQQQTRIDLERDIVRVEDDPFLPVMGRGGQPDRPPGQMLGHLAAFVLVAGQRGGAFLQGSGHLHALGRHPEAPEIHRRDVVLHQRPVEALQKAARHAAQEAPAVMARLRHAGVDDHHRHAASVGLADQRGQNSLSHQTARSGRQWSRNAVTKARASSGIYWWIAPSGRRSAMTPAEVTVPVVTRTVISRSSRMRRISSSSARLSPTLAAWNQMRGPSGAVLAGLAPTLGDAAGSSLPADSRS
jgi:hypothetical protein